MAGISLKATVGDNGIIDKARKAKEETIRSEIKETLEMKIIELQISKEEKGEKITKKDIEEAIGGLDGIEVDTSTKNVEGEYKEYGYEIDESYNVIIKDKLIGSKPSGFAEVITKIGDLEEVDISVVGNLKDGEISSIEALNGAELKEKINSSEYIFTVRDNDMYNFRIRGSNGRSITVSCTVENAIPLRDDLLTAIESVKVSAVRKFKIIGKENEEMEEKTEIYSLNVINYEGDLILDGKKQIEGSTITSNTYLFGNTADISNGSNYAKNTVVLKVNGNLTINSGITLTTILGSNGGPLGLLVYTTGQLINNGLITMSERAAYSAGQNVYLYKKVNNSFEFIPKNGGLGGIGGSGQAAHGFYQGSPGGNGTNRACRRRFRRNLVY